MRHKDRDAGFLLDMLEAAHRIEDCVEGQTAAKFGRDRLRVMATERAFEVLGSAAASVSEGLRDAHPELPWRQLIGVRDALARGGGVPHEALYQAATARVPGLIATLEQLSPWK